MMSDYVKMSNYGGEIHICLYIETEKILKIGEKINALNENAYMNGYNWDAFFNYYLAKNEPDVLEEIDPDPEAGMYTAHYPLTPENELRAKKFVEIIRSLIENEEELYRIIKEEGDEIEWD